MTINTIDTTALVVERILGTPTAKTEFVRNLVAVRSAQGKMPRFIAKELRSLKVTTKFGNQWTPAAVHTVLYRIRKEGLVGDPVTLHRVLSTIRAALPTTVQLPVSNSEVSDEGTWNLVVRLMDSNLMPVDKKQIAKIILRKSTLNGTV